MKGPFPEPELINQSGRGPAILTEETRHVDNGSVVHIVETDSAYLINSQCCAIVAVFTTYNRLGSSA